MPDTTDHEEILLIRQDIKNLKESQLEFHKEVRQNFEELKNNYSSTLANHESRIANLEATRIDFREKVSSVTTYYKWLLVGVGLIFALMLWHLTGYHI